MYSNSRAGFTRQTDSIPFLGGGLGATHNRVQNWYFGTSDLTWSELQPSYYDEWNSDPLYRRRSDFQYNVLFDQDFYNSYPNFINPWYTPNHSDSNFVNGAANAPWEGIGTGWFFSVLGGGKDKRGTTNINSRVPLDFDNTYEARMRGDFAVPTLFNGNFDAVFQPDDGFRKHISKEIPGWSFHNNSTLPSSVTVDNLKKWSQINSLTELAKTASRSPDEDWALELESGESITHDRFVVPDWGVLRFDVHVPNTGGNLAVSLDMLDESLTDQNRIFDLTELIIRFC